MATAYHRKKRPELVRRALLDCAAKLALEQGLSAVTVQAVCHAAGVTKGALFHHFPSKQALVEGVVADLIAQLDAEIDAAMAKDPRPYGRYTRAYVDITLHDPMMTEGSQWAALHISILAEPPLRRMVSAWFAERLHRHRDTDGSADLEFVRLAAVKRREIFDEREVEPQQRHDEKQYTQVIEVHVLDVRLEPIGRPKNDHRQ